MDAGGRPRELRGRQTPQREGRAARPPSPPGSSRHSPPVPSPKRTPGHLTPDESSPSSTQTTAQSLAQSHSHGLRAKGSMMVDSTCQPGGPRGVWAGVSLVEVSV